MNKTTYCPHCEKEVEFKVIETLGKDLLDDREYEYNKKNAFCEECGLEVFVDEIHDYNLESIYDEYRKSNGIITMDGLKAIPGKYAIGKRPLSLLLGWGEQTITRYLDGKIPSKEYSNELKMVLEDPRYYNFILEKNKEKIVAAAYEKSKRKVTKMIEEGALSEPAIDRVANYLICICRDLTPLALQKGLYYINGFYSAFYDTSLFEEQCQAWAHGPVYARIYRKYKEFLYNPIAAETNNAVIILTSSEQAIADNVAKYLCCYSGKILEEFTHTESPWLEARKDVPEGKRSENIITNESVTQYFKKVLKKYDIDDPIEIKKYAEKKFANVFW